GLARQTVRPHQAHRGGGQGDGRTLARSARVAIMRKPPPRATRGFGPGAVDLARFLPMFFQETEEHLAAMEGHLLRLDPRSPDAEALHSIFRAAHSIKGNSTIFGATHLAEVMH